MNKGSGNSGGISQKASISYKGWQIAAFALTTLFLGIINKIVSPPMLLLERYHAGAGIFQILFMGFYSAWLTGLFMLPQNSLRYRPRIWTFFSVVFFLQFLLGLAGFEKMLMTGKLHLPLPALIIAGPIYRGTGFFMLILFFAAALMVGPAWCSHLCYIGAWDDRISRMAAIRKPLPKWAGKARIAIFIITITLPVVLRTAGFTSFHAVSVAFVFAVISAAVVLLFSTRYGAMVHCSSFCPAGLLGNILGRLSPFRIRIASSCSECMNCTKVCRYNALSHESIRNRTVGSTCTLCGDCVAGCHSGSTGYYLPWFSPLAARKIFVTIIITMHSIFLAVARI